MVAYHNHYRIPKTSYILVMHIILCALIVLHGYEYWICKASLHDLLAVIVWLLHRGIYACYDSSALFVTLI